MIHNRMEKRLRFESLEQKQLLAADLSVAVIGGDLVITGDAEPNSFILSSGDVLNEQFRIENRIFGDTINGQFDELFISGVTGNVIINTGGADDVVRIFGDGPGPLAFPGDLRINLGDGEDQLFLGHAQFNFDFQLPLAIGDDLIIEGGAGDDSFELTALQVTDDFNIIDTQGSNALNMLPGFFFAFDDESTTVGDDFTVIMGSGNDEIGIDQAVVGDNLFVVANGGDDAVFVVNSEVHGSTFVNLGSGSNEMQAELLDAGHALTVVGTGTNNIFLNEVTSSSLIAIVTTNGNDVVNIFNSSTGLAFISTGGGADELAIIDSAFEALAIQLGNGDDSLTLGGVDVSEWALLSGGRGSDTLVDLGGNDINWELDFGFEIFDDLSA